MIINIKSTMNNICLITKNTRLTTRGKKTLRTQDIGVNMIDDYRSDSY